MQSVVLTGAAGGIGTETVRRLVAGGYVTYAGYMDDWEAQQLEKLKAELNTDLIIPVLCDIREPAQINAVFERVEQENPDLAAVIGNGGACPLGIPFEHIDFEITRDVYETNLMGNAKLAQRGLNLLKKSKGRIVFVGSLWGKEAGPMLMSYSASKHAMEALCTCARRELKPFGIDVVMINPGLVKNTYMTGNQLEQSKDALRLIGTAPERICTEIYDRGCNSKLKHATPVGDPHYENDYIGLNFMLSNGLHPDKMKKICCTAADCANAILVAMTVSKPKTRYIVGLDAKILIFLKWLLPERWSDKVMAATAVRK
jgi:NAD(P)-dependent dehydrogenase (short-subunit alcohol dehydrogenase family)